MNNEYSAVRGQSKVLILSLFILLCIIPAVSAKPLLPHPAATAANCQTAKCHLGLTTHPSASKCLACHSLKAAGHPDKKQKSTLKAYNCLKCHKTTVDYGYLHAPVAAGDCLSCHNPHASKNSMYIDRQGAKIICYKCHSSVVRKTDTVLHGPVKNDKCQLCHTPHGSYFPNLLKGEYSTKYFNDYTADTYKFCFRCHKIDLLLYPTTSYNTNFRDGKKNLHYLHTHRPRGIACKLCHRVHASRQPELMADKVKFGDWQMPINFTITKNGGRCLPGCHAARSYNRTIKYKR